MQRALLVFLATTALAPFAVALVARTAWKLWRRADRDAPAGPWQSRSRQGRAPARSPTAHNAGLARASRKSSGSTPASGRGRTVQGRPLRDRSRPPSPSRSSTRLVKGAADELGHRHRTRGQEPSRSPEILDAAGVAGKASPSAKAMDPAFAAELGLRGNTLEGLPVPGPSPAAAQDGGARADPPAASPPPGLWRAASRAREGGGRS